MYLQRLDRHNDSFNLYSDLISEKLFQCPTKSFHIAVWFKDQSERMDSLCGCRRAHITQTETDEAFNTVIISVIMNSDSLMNCECIYIH